MKIFKIGSFELPSYAQLRLDQSYEPIGGESIFRAISGLGLKQMSYSRTRVVTSGAGWVPPGLNAIDYKIKHLVACVVPESLPADSVTRHVTLPTTRRADAGHMPFGLAQLADFRTVATSVSLAGHVATLAEVPGAVAYQVGYYPLLLCWVMRPKKSGPDYAWEITCEEV